MNVKKFTAPTSREALRKVRESLGPDAVILSNRQADGGVEILALANDDAASLAMPAPHSPMADPAPSLDLNTAVPQGRADQRIEPRFESRTEPRMESRTDSRFEPRMETNYPTPAPAAQPSLPAQPVRRVVASAASFASATRAAAAAEAPAMVDVG
jgi:flagellar biosynthesis protein FlhF